MKYGMNQKIITIKRRIDVTEDLRNFIFKNINYRRKVWNDFVEESRKYDFISDFDINEFRKSYFRDIEEPNKIYDDFCVGISQQVATDMLYARKTIMSNKSYFSKFQFRRFDRFHGSFKVEVRPSYVPTKSGIPRFNSRVYITDTDMILFRVKGYSKLMPIHLRENLFYETIYDDVDPRPYFVDKNRQYYFRENDIKEISFLHDMGNFYIALSIKTNCAYQIKFRHKKLGIDLGIKNPVTCWDGNTFQVFKMSSRELSRIRYLERRAARLQQIMDRKLICNDFIKSKNYVRVQRKYRITWKKIRMIRANWRRKLCKDLCTTYKTIVVDSFTMPDNQMQSNMSRRRQRKIRNANHRHGMRLFYNHLIHSGQKFGTKIYQSPKYTTRRCSICGHINSKHTLDDRIMVCELCGTKLDRDLNGAINCYESNIKDLKIAVC